MALVKVEPDVFVKRSDVLTIMALLEQQQKTPSNNEELAQTSCLLFVAADLLPDVETRASFRQKLEHDLQKTGGASFSELFKMILSDWVLSNGQAATVETLTSSLCSNGLPKLAEIIERTLLPSSMASKKEKSSNERSLNEDPVTKVLSNPFILGEIFKNLSFEDQKQFRVVNRSWWMDTVKYNWRKSVWFNIRAAGVKGMDEEEGSRILACPTFEDFLHQFSNAEEDFYHLLEFPYRCYFFLEAYAIRPPLPFNQAQVAFWNAVGPQMTALKLHNCCLNRSLAGDIFNSLRWLVLEACPNLEELTVIAYASDDELRNGGRTETKTSGSREVRKEATKLNYLELVGRPLDFDAKEFFKLFPNLKVFNGRYIRDLEGIEHRLPNGNYIQLEKLLLGDTNFASPFIPPQLFHFRPLLTYSTSVSSSTVTHLEITKAVLLSAREPPFEMYRALYNFRSRLQTLKLMFVESEGPKWITEWFSDLCFIIFPKLTKFALRFDSGTRYGADFFLDFATLKGMLNLKELSVKYSQNAKHYTRGERGGTVDWILQSEDSDEEKEQRQRNKFVPEDLRQTAPYPHLLHSTPLHLPKLKKLLFRGFPLNLEDINYFHLWFPNLLHFEATFNRDAVRGALQTWEGLKTLRLISLQERSGDFDLTPEQLQVLCRDFPQVDIGFAKVERNNHDGCAGYESDDDNYSEDSWVDQDSEDDDDYDS